MNRRKPKRVAKTREQGTTWPQRFLFISCVFALAGLSGLFQSDVVLPQCTPGVIPGVVSNTQLNGKLVHTRRKFLIDVGDGEEHVLAKCSRNNCSRPYEILDRENIGKAAHAEFCGPFLTLVSLNHQPVYINQPPTQARIDRDASVGWKVGLFCFTYLAAVALYLARLFVKQSRATGTKA